MGFIFFVLKLGPFLVVFPTHLLITYRCARVIVDQKYYVKEYFINVVFDV